MPTLARDTTNSAKNLAQQIAKQVAREPLEILRDAKEQTSGETLNPSVNQQEDQNEEQKRLINDQEKIGDKMKSGRRMEALTREIEDIRKQSIFKDLQRRISEGEEISLEEYPELSLEQKQVLMAQMEAVKNQRSMANKNTLTEVPTIHSKPSRRFGAGQKSQAEKEQTRVEKPVPPSG
jgi:hypothetical protein